MTEWNTIDTAPQDKAVDLWVIEKTVGPNGTIEITPGWRWTNCEWNVQEQYWVSRDAGGGGYILVGQITGGRRIPTHWMFPPAAPGLAVVPRDATVEMEAIASNALDDFYSGGKADSVSEAAGAVYAAMIAAGEVK